MQFGKIYDRAVDGIGLLLIALGTWKQFQPPDLVPALSAPHPGVAHASAWWPWPLIFLGGSLLAVSLIRGALATRSNAGPHISRWNLAGINVHRYYAHPERLAKDHLISLVLTVFNASGVPINVVKISGYILVRGFGDTVLTAAVSLPRPQIILDREFVEKHDNMSSFQIKIEQWMGSLEAAELHRRLTLGRSVEFDLQNLKLVVAPTDGPLQAATLKLADRIVLRSDQPGEAQQIVVVKATASNAPLGVRL